MAHPTNDRIRPKPALLHTLNTRSMLALLCDLLDEIDNSAPELSLLDARKRLGEGEPLGSSEEIRNVGGGGRILHYAPGAMQVRRPFEEKFDRHLKNVGDLL